MVEWKDREYTKRFVAPKKVSVAQRLINSGRNLKERASTFVQTKALPAAKVAIVKIGEQAKTELKGLTSQAPAVAKKVVAGIQRVGNQAQQNIPTKPVQMPNMYSSNKFSGFGSNKSRAGFVENDWANKNANSTNFLNTPGEHKMQVKTNDYLIKNSKLKQRIKRLM